MPKQFYFKQFSLPLVRCLNAKTILFQAIQFSIKYAVYFYLTLDRTLSGAIAPGQSEPGSNGTEGVHRIPQSSSITRTSLSDCLVSNS